MGDSAAANFFESYTIASDHKDLIHDIAYDFYGERMATCSSDQYIKVWDVDEQGDWKQTASWKAHHGSVWKVTWAHPEFGQVLASCSFDRTAAIWEEVGDTTATGTDKGLRTWVKRSNLVDSRTSVTDVKFGPKHLGLLLVTCSADGIIRIYEAPDVMNLAQWTLQHEIPTKVSISSLSWNPSLSRVNPPMLAVGSDEPNTPNSSNAAATSNQIDKSASNGKVFIYEYSEASRRWTRSEVVSCVTEPVNDLAFAPNLGRSFHLLAVATKDVTIVKIEPLPESSGGGVRFRSSVVAAFDSQYVCVWRVSWNVTGTLLASAGDDCTVTLWHMQYLNQWRCVAVFRGEEGAGAAAEGGAEGGAGGGAGSAGGGAGSAGGGAGGAGRGRRAGAPATAYVRLAPMLRGKHMPVH